MWNTYRQCQLHLTDLICRINAALATSLENQSNSRESRKLLGEIEEFIDDIFASVPFMLVGDTIRHCRPSGAMWSLPKPPMLLGGLNLQWRLFTIAMMQSAPPGKRQHARDLLKWCGDSLGIGQAKVLAEVCHCSSLVLLTEADVRRRMILDMEASLQRVTPSRG